MSVLERSVEEAPSWRAMPVQSSLHRRGAAGGPGHAAADCAAACRRGVAAVPWPAWLAWQYVLSALCLFAARAAFPASLGERSKSFGGLDELNEVVAVLLPVTLLLTRVSLDRPVALIALLHAGAVALAAVGVAISAHAGGGFFPVACVFTSLAVATTSVAALVWGQQACCHTPAPRGGRVRCTSCLVYQLVAVLASAATVGVFSSLGLLRGQVPAVFLVSCLAGVCVFFSVYRATSCRPSSQSAYLATPSPPRGVTLVGLVLLDTTLVLYLEFLCRIFIAAAQCHKTSRVHYWPRTRAATARGLDFDRDDNDDGTGSLDEYSLHTPAGARPAGRDAVGLAVKHDGDGGRGGNSVAVNVMMELRAAPERELKHRRQMSSLVKVSLDNTNARVAPRTHARAHTRTRTHAAHKHCPPFIVLSTYIHIPSNARHLRTLTLA